jgi:hypothetical protein
MNTLDPHHTHARELRADLLASPTVWLPRREVILNWLGAFLQRGATSKYVLGVTEENDLAELDQFLRKNDVPRAA